MQEVRIPTGISAGAQSVRTAVLHATRNVPPNSVRSHVIMGLYI